MDDDASFVSPDWTYVSELPPRGRASEDEWEEDEVSYVSLDLGNHVDSRTVRNAGEIQLAGFDSETPLLRVGNRVLRGTHDSLLGSEITLRKDDDQDSLHEPISTTSRRVLFEPVPQTTEEGQEGEGPGHDHGRSTPVRGRRRGRARGSAARQG